MSDDSKGLLGWFGKRKEGVIQSGMRAHALSVFDCVTELGNATRSMESGDTLTSRNVYGFIQGYDRTLNGRYIVIGARMDNLGTNVMTVDGSKVTQTYTGANGNASGIAMMLELARMVSVNSLVFRRSVIFIGFGASSEGYAGAW